MATYAYLAYIYIYIYIYYDTGSAGPSPLLNGYGSRVAAPPQWVWVQTPPLPVDVGVDGLGSCGANHHNNNIKQTKRTDGLGFL